ncbi:MAG: hypothetical protein C0445_06925 [Polaromonas sp.]|nr:hypothetical protein [Polaromonas sp.]
MRISPFFHALESAYQAELDDLTFDSDGKDVLRHRLADKRKALAFLCQMIDISPEMVAVVFHQGFQFKSPAAMERLVSQGSDHLPDWDQLAEVVTLQPWATALATDILKAPKGAWLLAVAAGLEYLYHKPGQHQAAAHDAEADEDSEGDSDQDQSDDPRGDEDDGDMRGGEDAGEDWMEAQGFDRKTH